MSTTGQNGEGHAEEGVPGSTPGSAEQAGAANAVPPTTPVVTPVPTNPDYANTIGGAYGHGGIVLKWPTHPGDYGKDGGKKGGWSKGEGEEGSKGSKGPTTAAGIVDAADGRVPRRRCWR